MVNPHQAFYTNPILTVLFSSLPLMRYWGIQVKSLSSLGVNNPMYSYIILDRSRRLIRPVSGCVLELLDLDRVAFVVNVLGIVSHGTGLKTVTLFFFVLVVLCLILC